MIPLPSWKSTLTAVVIHTPVVVSSLGYMMNVVNTEVLALVVVSDPTLGADVTDTIVSGVGIVYQRCPLLSGKYISGVVHPQGNEVVQGLRVNYSGTVTGTIVTGPNGLYESPWLRLHGNYTLRLTAPFHDIHPALIQVTDLTANLPNQDFTITRRRVTVRGTIHPAANESVVGIKVEYAGASHGEAQTQHDGSYSLLNLLEGGDYTITPEVPAHHTLQPTSTAIVGLMPTQGTVDFTLTRNKVSLTGTLSVNDGSAANEGCIIRFAGETGGDVTTIGGGAFSILNLLEGGNYTITADAVNHYNLAPAQVIRNDIAGGQTAAFALTRKLVTLVGTVSVDDGTASNTGITIRFTGPTAGTAITIANGAFSIPNLYEGGDYRITPDPVIHYDLDHGYLDRLNLAALQRADFALTRIRVTITGRVAPAALENVNGIRVDYAGTSAGFVNTLANGSFTIPGLLEGGHYTITPQIPVLHVLDYANVVLPSVAQGDTPNFVLTRVPPPIINNLGTVAGTTSGGTTVVVNGANFVPGLTVTLGGANANIVGPVLANTITITTPLHVVGAVDVRVTNPDAQLDTLVNGFEYRPPQVVSINPPSSGFAGNVPATVTGNYFGTNVTVRIGANQAANVVRLSEQSITITLPAHTNAHPVLRPVRVTNTHDNLAGTTQGLFTYVPMTVVSVQPNMGPHTGNTPIIVNGTGFDAGVTMTIGGQDAAAVYGGPNQFTATSPALAWPSALPVDVVVTNGDGQTVSLADEFNYTAPHVVTAVVPPIGANGGGNVVSLYGAGFTIGSIVRFGGILAGNVGLYSANELRVTVPVPAGVHANAFTVNVQVDANGTSSTLPNGYTYEAAPPRRNVVIYPAGHDFTSIAAIGGNNADTLLALRGLHNDGELSAEEGLWSADQVGQVRHKHIAGAAGGLLFLCHQAAPHRVHQIIDITMGRFGNNYPVNLIATPSGRWHLPPNQTQLVRANHDRALRLTLADGGGIQTAIDDAFGLNSIEPAQASVDGVWTVTITGTGIPNVVTVTVGGVNALNVVRINDTTLTATLPAHGVGVVAVRVVETATLIRADLPNAVTYQAFALTSVTRRIGTNAGGDTLVLVGTGFEPNATVVIGVAAQNIVVHGPTCITCDTPLQPIGNVNVVVTNPVSGATVNHPFDFL